MKRALISVSNKVGLIDFAKGLVALGWQIISTGGTAKVLQKAGIKVKLVSAVTGFPEIMDGRIKTLHPKILAGILADRSDRKHLKEARLHGIEFIDMVVVNFYQFKEIARSLNAIPTAGKKFYTTQRLTSVEDPSILSSSADIAGDSTQDDNDRRARELIDIGGPTMLRAAAKNWEHVISVTDPIDYVPVLQELKDKGDVAKETRKKLALKVFEQTTTYDGVIADYFRLLLEQRHSPGKVTLNEQARLPSSADRHTISQFRVGDNIITLSFKKLYDLRYGENPHQRASLYQNLRVRGVGIPSAEVLQGKQLSFNNILDAEAALDLVREFGEPAAAIIKHTNPCGAAIAPAPPSQSNLSEEQNSAELITKALMKAYKADPLSAFGGIIALNRSCPREVAEFLRNKFVEVILAPAFDSKALAIFKKKKNLRLIRTKKQFSDEVSELDFRYLVGGLLVEEKNRKIAASQELKVVTTKQPSELEIKDLLFAWRVVKHCKSNAIVIAKGGVTAGLGIGQTSRVGSVEIAVKQAVKKMNGEAMRQMSEKENITQSQQRAEQAAGLVCASDGFFPFADSIELLAKIGISAVIQPGGSKNDTQVIEAANDKGLSMVFTGYRVFRH